MGSTPVYRRILLKLSGEVLKGDAAGVDPAAVLTAARQVADLAATGVQVALVIGGGNFFRGLPASRQGGISRATADQMGMLATVMNGLAMRDGLEACGVRARVQSAIPMAGVAEPFDRQRAIRCLEKGMIVLFAGGTGHAFFTTDTTAALRACEIEAEAILKATKVDGVYTADPKRDPAARRYRQLSYRDALEQRLEVMDATAFSLCRENRIPIVVFNYFGSGNLCRVAAGDTAAATVVGDLPTLLADPN